MIVFPPPSDLVVTDIGSPATARSGEPVEISWTVSNQSGQPLSGTWSDAVYLSGDATWDIDDRPMGKFAFSGSVAAGETYTQSTIVNLPPATPGEYRVIVRTDIFNQVFELEKDLNNTTASPNALSVQCRRVAFGNSQRSASRCRRVKAVSDLRAPEPDAANSCNKRRSRVDQ